MADCLPVRRDDAVALWDEYCSASGHAKEPTPNADFFGDSRELADELCDLVLEGRKRATAGLVADYEREEVPVPEQGRHFIVADGAGESRCIVRTTDVRIGPVSGVDDAFAWDEGEGDRSRAYWLSAHRSFFGRRCADLRISYHDGLDVVFQRFEVVWPPKP